MNDQDTKTLLSILDLILAGYGCKLVRFDIEFLDVLTGEPGRILSGDAE